MPSAAEIIGTIETYLSTMPKDARVELGFFGGTFTGLPFAEQQRLLGLVKPYPFASIRLSTRPDYIDERIVDMLAEGGVGTVELGVQSLDEEVLRAVHRGYGVEEVERAARLVQSRGMEVGMQMMVGLPGDTPEKSLATARRIVELGATNTRIYPTLVVKQTLLATLYEQGRYHALTIDEAVRWTAPVLRLFEESGLTVLRVGLHPTEGFISHADYLAGPFHVSFKELVMTEIFRQQFASLPEGVEMIYVNPSKRNAAIGYNARNLNLLRPHSPHLRILPDPSIEGYDFTFVTAPNSQSNYPSKSRKQ